MSYIGGVSMNLNDENIFDTIRSTNESEIESDDERSRPESSQSKQSSRSSRSRSSRGSSRRSRGGLDDVTIRQMFRRYLCSPSKETEVIKQQLQIIQRELNLILDDEENYNSEDFSDTGYNDT